MKYLGSKKALLLAGIAASALAYFLSGRINGYYLQVLLFVGINVILATSLNLINGYTGQFSLGHAGFIGVGAYAASVITLAARNTAGDSGGFALPAVLRPLFHAVQILPPWLQFLAALLGGGLAAAVAGLVVGVPSLRLRGDYLAIVTLGFNQIIVVLLQNIEFVGGPRGLGGITGYNNLFWTFAIMSLTIYGIVSLIDSTYGRGFLTVRDDEIAAEAMGIDTTRYKVVAFILGSFVAGVGGGLYAHTTTYINPGGFDFQLSIQIVVMVILGGMGSTAGVAFAAVLLTVLLEYLRFVSGYEFLPGWVREIARNRMIIFSLALIVLMLLRPQGLFGGLRAFGAGATRKIPRPAAP